GWHVDLLGSEPAVLSQWFNDAECHALLELTADKTVWSGSTVEERISQAYAGYVAACKRNKESVVLIRWLANLTHRVAAETKTEHDRMRAALFLAMASMRKIFSDGGLILDESSLKKAAYSCGVYFDALYWLANEAIANKQVLWKLAVTCHPAALGKTVLQRYAWHACVRWLAES
ncbi:unnamed protein product, partial [Symbiodinium sp. KB8]